MWSHVPSYRGFGFLLRYVALEKDIEPLHAALPFE